MKEITTRQMAMIKRIAMNVNPLVVKKNKLASKINELTVEIAEINDAIEGNEMGIKTITGGLSSEVLITKTVTDSGKVDKNGDSISYRYKSTGNMVDQYITPEGKFEIVLYGKSSFDEKEKKSIREFVTNDDGVYPAKSPIGMFDLYIPNDLGLVVDKIAEYYE